MLQAETLDIGSKPLAFFLDFLSGIRNTEGKLKSKQKNPGDGCALTFVTTYSEFKMLRYLPEGGNSEPSQKAKL